MEPIECARCHATKPPEEFCADQGRPSGKHRQCKACRLIMAKQYRANARARFDANPRTEKKCSRCNQVKPATEFYSLKTSVDGLAQYCKECARADSRRRYSENPDRSVLYSQEMRKRPDFNEKMRAYLAEWRKKHPGKATEYTMRRKRRKIENGGSHTPDEFRELCEFYGNVCLCCLEEKPLVPDHVIPVSKGGSDDISNIQPLCQQCNHRKSTHKTDYRPK